MNFPGNRWLAGPSDLIVECQRVGAGIIVLSVHFLPHDSEFSVLISVVIPTLDRPHFLEEAVKSVVVQTYHDWEVIIIDDGSRSPVSINTETPAVSDRITIIRNDHPSGVAQAKNTGIAVAKGEVITILDDDDTLAPDALERIASAFNHLPSLDCLFLKVSPFGPFAERPTVNQRNAMKQLLRETKHQQYDDFLLFGKDLVLYLANRVPIDFQRPAARRGAWNIVGPYQTESLYSESAWAIKAALLCTVALSSSPLSNWRIHGKNFGWSAGQDEIDARLRQIENDSETTLLLLQDVKVSKVRLSKLQLALKRKLSNEYFSKAYILRDKCFGESLKALAGSFRALFQIKQVRLFLSYLWVWPANRSCPKATRKGGTRN